MNAVTARPSSALALVLLLLGGLGFAAAWCLLAGALQSQAAWMAPLAALDAVLMLRLGRMPADWRRPAWAFIATLATILLANWGIAAIEIGRSMGLLPWDSALRLGPVYAWELLRLANGPAELAWYVLALVLAAVGAFSRPR